MKDEREEGCDQRIQVVFKIRGMYKAGVEGKKCIRLQRVFSRKERKRSVNKKERTKEERKGRCVVVESLGRRVFEGLDGLTQSLSDQGQVKITKVTQSR